MRKLNFILLILIMLSVKKKDDIAATTKYGLNFTSAVQKQNFWSSISSRKKS